MVDVRGMDGRLESLRHRLSVRSGDHGIYDDPAQGCHPTHLVDAGVGVLIHDDRVPRPAVHEGRDEIAHGAGRHEEAGFLA